jgi:hypothetical protein
MSQQSFVSRASGTVLSLEYRHPGPRLRVTGPAGEVRLNADLSWMQLRRLAEELRLIIGLYDHFEVRPQMIRDFEAIPVTGDVPEFALMDGLPL